ncbi:unnamed protein product [Caenorhabditis sp. 36 PRJEB53466]|nr:unnamed protein product [Caenorhabditis sp. 36 PRJEB53466]
MPSVLIAGGGLVGSANACFFAQKGWSVRVFESRPDPRGELFEPGKSFNLALAHRTMAALERIGLKETVIEKGFPITKRRVYLEAQGGHLEKWPVLKDDDFVLTMNRQQLSEILINEAESYRNVEYKFNHKALCFNFDSQNLEVDTPEGVISVDADLILACDGAHSSIRRSLLKVPRFNFEQTYAEYGYMDMSAKSAKGLEKGVHNLWIRDGIMLVALVNRDNSLSVSIFAKFEEFERKLSTPEVSVPFFKRNFPEIVAILGEKHVSEMFVRNKPQAIISVKCSQHAFFDKLLLMGDAAHALVPFTGHGANCGFEDCLVLQEILEKNDGMSIEKSVREYSEVRTEDTNAMNRMAWKAHLTLDRTVYKVPVSWTEKFMSLLRSAADRLLTHPSLLATHSRVPYAEIERKAKFSDNLPRHILAVILIVFALLSLVFSAI